MADLRVTHLSFGKPTSSPEPDTSVLEAAPEPIQVGRIRRANGVIFCRLAVTKTIKYGKHVACRGVNALNTAQIATGRLQRCKKRACASRAHKLN